jgi:hypothetical protein
MISRRVCILHVYTRSSRIHADGASYMDLYDLRSTEYTVTMVAAAIWSKSAI